MKAITHLTAITTFLLLSISISAQTNQFGDSSKKYRDKYSDQLNEGEEIKKSWYHYVTTETDNKEYFARIFYPDTKQITSYEQYKSKKCKIKSGIAKYWTDEGILKSEGFYKENLKVGIWKTYNRYKGYLERIGVYKKGREFGVWTNFSEEGDTTSQYTYDQGLRHGAFIVYDSLGQIYNQGVYNNDTILTETRIDTLVEQERVTTEEMPMFRDEECQSMISYTERKKCADNKMLRYIYGNLKYPAKARELGIQGRVILRFVVSKEGKIKEINVLNGICDEMKNECIRVIESMPTWNPGTQDGEPVNVIFTLPISFRLS